MSPSDIDLYEMNEAFASVVLRFMEDLGVEHDKTNVNGGAIAMGHPLGATGAMILGTLLDELERTGQGHRPRHAVRRRRHGHGHDHRARLSSFVADQEPPHATGPEAAAPRNLAVCLTACCWASRLVRRQGSPWKISRSAWAWRSPFGITFSFLSPLVRESLSKKTPEDAAADHSGASSEEHDDK
jgi:hypothetical protein